MYLYQLLIVNDEKNKILTIDKRLKVEKKITKLENELKVILQLKQYRTMKWR